MIVHLQLLDKDKLTALGLKCTNCFFHSITYEKANRILKEYLVSAACIIVNMSHSFLKLDDPQT